MPTLPAATVSNNHKGRKDTLIASDKVAPANRHFDIVSLASNYVSQLTRVSGTRTTTRHGHRNISSIDLKLFIIASSDEHHTCPHGRFSKNRMRDRALDATRAQPSSALADDRIH